jgi:hypothetical protein
MSMFKSLELGLLLGIDDQQNSAFDTNRMLDRVQQSRAGARSRSRSKPARGAREAGPRGICGGGPSAELLSETSTALSRS